MTKESAIRLFESKKVRVLWDDTTEKWYFSIIDIIRILSGSKNPRRYWSDLKIKLNKEGSQLYEKIVQLKKVSRKGGGVAGNARRDLEKKLGSSVVSPLNAKDIERKNREQIEGNKE